jgi:hypothetical protein
MMMQGPGTCQAKQKRLTHHQRETKMKTTKYFFSTTFFGLAASILYSSFKLTLQVCFQQLTWNEHFEDTKV